MALQEREKLEIKYSKLLLVEGIDAYYFWIWALQPFGVGDVQVMDFGGITELTVFLKTLSGLSGYDKVTTIVIARDAETNSKTAVDNIKKALLKAQLSVPVNSFEFSVTTPRVAFMLFPGFDDNKKLISGTLEDLCVKIIKDSDNQKLDCVKAYLDCLGNYLSEKGQEIKRPHKTFLHAYFAGDNKYVGMKIGEASQAGVWDWGHDKLKPFKNVITSM
jgi:hypothetical protein